MKSPVTMVMALGVAGVLTLASVDAEAQRIRTFHDEGDGQVSGTQVYAPGQPVPQQREAAPADAAGESAGGESSSEVAGSYRISMHGAAGQRDRQRELDRILSLTPLELYRGVIPGQREEMAHLARFKQEGARTDRPNRLTWVGFQPEAERTRVFLQSARPLRYRLSDGSDANELVITLENARISERNFARFIDTSYFDRSVQRIDVSERRDGSIEVRLKMRSGERPSVSSEGSFLFLDFPHRSDDGQ